MKRRIIEFEKHCWKEWFRDCEVNSTYNQMINQEIIYMIQNQIVTVKTWHTKHSSPLASTTNVNRRLLIFISRKDKESLRAQYWLMRFKFLPYIYKLLVIFYVEFRRKLRSPKRVGEWYTIHYIPRKASGHMYTYLGIERNK